MRDSDLSGILHATLNAGAADLVVFCACCVFWAPGWGWVWYVGAGRIISV